MNKATNLNLKTEVMLQNEESQYLTFQLAQEMFAIDIMHIKEIIEYGKITSVPNMPHFVRGVINLRGRVVPVIDLHVRFGWDVQKPGKRTCIVIVEVEGADNERQDIGVVVDAVSEVIEIPQTDIEKAPSFGANLRTDFIAGMGKVKGEFVILLNLSAALSVDEMASIIEGQKSL